MTPPLRDPARAARVDRVVQALAEQGVDAVWVDRAPVLDKGTLMHALYQALELPAWFGFNWDALHDVLGDLGREGMPLVLIFDDFETLERRDPDAAHTFLDIVAEVVSDPESVLRGVLRVDEFPHAFGP